MEQKKILPVLLAAIVALALLLWQWDVGHAGTSPLAENPAATLPATESTATHSTGATQAPGETAQTTIPRLLHPSFTPKTFNETTGPVCVKNGKPIIRMYSTPWCPHCNWVKGTFDRVAKEYASEDKILAYHWDLEEYDDLLTPAYEGTIPESEIDLYEKYNPEGYVPAFIFGCKYMRTGNGYESTGDLAAEEAEFRDIIDELVNSG